MRLQNVNPQLLLWSHNNIYALFTLIVTLKKIKVSNMKLHTCINHYRILTDIFKNKVMVEIYTHTHTHTQMCAFSLFQEKCTCFKVKINYNAS